MFSRYRAPDIVVSDNGPQFASAEFTKFTISIPPTEASEEADPAYPVSDDCSTQPDIKNSQLCTKMFFSTSPKTTRLVHGLCSLVTLYS